MDREIEMERVVAKQQVSFILYALRLSTVIEVHNMARRGVSDHLISSINGSTALFPPSSADYFLFPIASTLFKNFYFMLNVL